MPRSGSLPRACSPREQRHTARSCWRALLVTRHIRFRHIPPDTQQRIVRDVAGERHRLPGCLWPDQLARHRGKVRLLKRAISVVHQRSNWQASVSS